MTSGAGKRSIIIHIGLEKIFYLVLGNVLLGKKIGGGGGGGGGGGIIITKLTVCISRSGCRF